MTNKILLSALLTAFAAQQAHAGIIDQVDPGAIFSVPDVVDFKPNGFSMAGIRVTATFADNSSQSVLWVGTDPVSGKATGTDWFLSESGDTYNHLWTLENDTAQSMKRLLIEGGALGHTLFDLQGPFRTTVGTVSPGGTDLSTGTTGSEHGYTFEPFNLSIFQTMGHTLNVTATYQNIVKLDSAAGPVGDLWTTLQLDFSGDLGGLLSGPANFGGPVPFTFYADTDLWGTNPVPEPSSLIVMLGLGFLGAWQCRRAHRALVV